MNNDELVVSFIFLDYVFSVRICWFQAVGITVHSGNSTPWKPNEQTKPTPPKRARTKLASKLARTNDDDRRGEQRATHNNIKVSLFFFISSMTTIQPSNGGNEAAQPAPPTISSAIMRGIMMYMFMTVAQRFAVQQGFITDPTSPQKVASTSATNVQNAAGNGNSPMKPQGVGVNPASMNVASFNGKNGVPSCIWKSRTLLDLHVYITDEEDFDPLTGCLPDMNGNTVKNNILSEYHELDLELSSVDSNKNYRNGNITVPLSKSVQFNETNVYAHVCLLKQKRTQALALAQGKDDHPSGNENDVEVYHKALSLTKYKTRKKARDEKNLLSTEDDANDAPAIIPEDASPLTKASADKKEEAVLLYFKPSLTLQLVDMTSMPPFPSKNKIPQSISKHIDWVNDTDIDTDTDGSTSTGTRTEKYYPLLYSSEFWIKNDALVEVNDTIHEVDLEITFENVKVWKWQLMSQMEETWRRQAETAGDDDAGTDMFRTMLLDTNPILLAVTAIISVLHTLFDMLAFKNDIKFFKNNKSMHGLSLRTMVVNTFFQVIILLYLLDNETSFMVLMSNGMGVAIEAWKISKAVKISLFDKDGNVAIAWKETETYTSSKTKEYDEIATDHLMFVTMPLVCGYGLYSLFYQRHKGWYSWIINTLVGFIYMFGFVMMTPQLFINYKLQSVAHLNWRTMTYKSINTFIDDLFGKYPCNTVQ